MNTKELIDVIVECAKLVRKQLSYGFEEKVYKNAMYIEHYLTATGIDDGLLINFGAEHLEIKHKTRLYYKCQ